MRALPIVQVDAFTDVPFGGNPCAVVFDADELSCETMQRIAREVNLSETAFVMDSEHADARARYFTPGEEIPMAGHPTIATVYSLLAKGRMEREYGRQHVKLELPVGVVDVEIAGQSGESPLITMTQLRPEFMQDHDRDEVAAAFSLSVDALRSDVPVVTVSTGTPQLMVPLVSHQALEQARVIPRNYDQLRAFGDFFSAHLFVPEGATADGDTFARHFGVPPDWREDSFTGSATGGMGAYLWRHELIRSPRFIAEQGHWMDRPGYAEVEVLGDRDDIHSVRVGGRAVEVMEGMFVIPDE
jgi:trans-2,3-dihydro-3-hydroxyanthranilate isomerase